MSYNGKPGEARSLKAQPPEPQAFNLEARENPKLFRGLGFRVWGEAQLPKDPHPPKILRPALKTTLKPERYGKPFTGL